MPSLSPISTARADDGGQTCRDPHPAAGGPPQDKDGEKQREMLSRLVVLAATSIGEMEKTLRIAGLDPAEVAPGTTGMGGPLVALGQGHGDGGGLAASLAALDVHLARWDELNRVIHSLPLAEPLVDYRVASPFGERLDPFTHKPAVHEGIDLAAKPGAAVEATADGTVIFAGTKPGYGHIVEINHGYGVTTLYAHLRTLLVRVGQRVATGNRLGRVGSSGRSTGPHLHYEIRVKGTPRDPAQFLYAGQVILAKGQ